MRGLILRRQWVRWRPLAQLTTPAPTRHHIRRTGGLRTRRKRHTGLRQPDLIFLVSHIRRPVTFPLRQAIPDGLRRPLRPGPTIDEETQIGLDIKGTGKTP